MRGTLIAIALALALSSGVAAAVERTDFNLSNTQDLFNVCTVAPGDPLVTEAIHYCVAYIEATVDYHDSMSGHAHLKPLFCDPAHTTRVEGAEAFIEWGSANQGNAKLMGEPTVVGVLRALGTKWPCK